MNDHRKFLKKIDLDTHIGKYFPIELILDGTGNTLNLEYFIHNSKGSFIFLMSTSCDACDIEVVKRFHSKYSKFNFLMFLQSDIEEKERYEKYLKIKIVSSTISRIAKQIDYNGLIPMVFVLNSKGQIVAGSVFNDIDDLEKISWPLLYVYS